MLYVAAALFFLPVAVAAWGFATIGADGWRDVEELPSESDDASR